MKKVPTFTLVRKFDFGVPKPLSSKAKTRERQYIEKGGLTDSAESSHSLQYSQAERAVLDTVKTLPGLYDAFSGLDSPFKKALVSSFVTIPTRSAKPRAKLKPNVSDSVISVTRDLARLDKVHRVGLLDMGAWIGGLPTLLERLNEAQSMFTIFEVQAPLPGGLLKTSRGMAEWVADHRATQKIRNRDEHFAPHVVFEDFLSAAESIRKGMGLDYIVGLTPALVAGVEPDGSVYLNHFSSVLGDTILLSTTDLRQFTEDANRPFEVGVGALLVAALLVAVNDKLEYHDDTGCLFDYNDNRASLIPALRQLSIDEQCLHKMTQGQREAATNMLGVLRRMKRRAS